MLRFQGFLALVQRRSPRPRRRRTKGSRCSRRAATGPIPPHARVRPPHRRLAAGVPRRDPAGCECGHDHAASSSRAARQDSPRGQTSLSRHPLTADAACWRARRGRAGAADRARRRRRILGGGDRPGLDTGDGVWSGARDRNHGGLRRHVPRNDRARPSRPVVMLVGIGFCGGADGGCCRTVSEAASEAQRADLQESGGNFRAAGRAGTQGVASSHGYFRQPECAAHRLGEAPDRAACHRWRTATKTRGGARTAQPARADGRTPRQARRFGRRLRTRPLRGIHRNPAGARTRMPRARSLRSRGQSRLACTFVRSGCMSIAPTIRRASKIPARVAFASDRHLTVEYVSRNRRGNSRCSHEAPRYS